MTDLKDTAEAPFQPTIVQSLYGAAHGSYDVPDWADDMFCDLLKTWERIYWNINQKPWEPHAHSIGTVTYRPYCWGDCDCGFAERWEGKEAEWEAAHPHAPACYQSVLKARMDAWDTEHRHVEIEARAFGPKGVSLFGGFDQHVDHPFPGVTTVIGTPRTDDAMEAWRMSHGARRTFEGALYDELTAQFGLSSFGCAVHCTCGKDIAWREFRATDDHAPDCQIVVPNFGINGDTIQIRWYKYPHRGMSVSVPMTPEMWIDWHARVVLEMEREEHAHTIDRREGYCGRTNCPFCEKKP